MRAFVREVCLSDTLKILVDRFAECVTMRSAALRRGDSDEANRFVRECVAIFWQLASFGNQGRDALAILFMHPLNSVRVASAAWLLRYKHDEAMQVLRAVAEGQDMDAFRAQQCMKRWEEGEWQLDPAPGGSMCNAGADPREPPPTL